MREGCCGSLRSISLNSCDVLHSCTAELSKWLVMLMWTLRLQEAGNTEGRLHGEEKEGNFFFFEGEVIKYICLTGAYVYTGGTNSNEYFWPSPHKCLLFSLDSDCQVFSWCNIECVTSYSQEISLEWLEQILLIKALSSSPWQVSGWVRNASTQKPSQGGKCSGKFLVDLYSLGCGFIQCCVGRGASAWCLAWKYKLSLWINKVSSWARWEVNEAFG